MDVMNSAYTSYAALAGYNALGQVGQIAFPMNGVNTTFQYEQATNRLHELTTTIPGSGTAQDFVYSYDNNGNIRTITDNVDPTQTQTFNYDWLNRLTTAQGAYGTLTYSLTGNPDPTGDIDNPGVSNSSYKQQALTYDYDNRVSSVNSTSFVYDYTGARVMKNNTVTYVNNLYEIRNGVAYKYIFAGGRRIVTSIGTSIYFCHPDHVGSLRIATDGSGNQAQAVTYYPFGEIRTNTGTVDLKYKFTGQEYDPDSKLYYFGARYYDPAIARFLSPDSIVQSAANPQSLARYSYCLNNPLAYLDPTGHFNVLSFIGSIIGGIAGGLTFFFTWNPILAGAVAGGVSGAFSGNPGNMVMGAVMGGISGMLGNVVQASFGTAGTIAMMGIGAGSAVANGGWSSLAYMGAGILGGAIGYGLGGYLNGSANSSTAQAADPQSSVGQDRDADGLSERLNRQPELWSSETYNSQSQFWNDLYAQGRYPYLGGTWNAMNAGDPIYAELGQSIWITASNASFYPTQLSVTANDTTLSTLLGPLGSHEFIFNAFGDSPIAWKISASTSPGGVVRFNIDSNWVPRPAY